MKIINATDNKIKNFKFVSKYSCPKTAHPKPVQTFEYFT